MSRRRKLDPARDQDRKPRKPGRPAVTDEQKEQCLSGIAEGLPKVHAAALAGMAESTFYRLQQEDAKFDSRIKQARYTFEYHLIQKIKKDESWGASAFLLERSFVENWGRIDRHMLHVEQHGGPLPEAYIQAITTALGMRGPLIPLRAEDVTGERPMLPAGDVSGNGHKDDELDIDEVLPL